MAIIPPHIVDQIMQTARIEEVIGEFVQLKKAGSSYKGLSPFTDEKTPSFVVSPAKQIFKCFSTGKGGSVVTFLMEREHYSYPEALRWLAKRYNIEIPEDRPATAEELAAITERESLFIINDFAKDYFTDQMMNSDEGKAIGKSYFVERGFRPETIEKFQLGYCPSKGDAFTKAALEKTYKLDYLKTLGLVKEKDDRKYDFFRGRVIFPIHSVSGRVLGFGARTLQKDGKVKYLNSPENPIYHKSDILYGLFYAKSDIIKYDNCYLCEGYTDVISLHQSGLTNVVSSSGTSLTVEQIKLVSRFTKNITILYDGDAAGIKASFRGIDLILEEGLTVKVVLFPTGEDPDSYAKAHSSDELKAYVEDHAQDFVTFKTEILLADAKNDPIQKAKLITDVVRSVSKIPDQIIRSVYSKEVAKLFELDEQVVVTEIAKQRGHHVEQVSKTPIPAPVTPQPTSPTSNENSSTAPVKRTEQMTKFEFAEFALIRALIKYGVFGVTTRQTKEDGVVEEVQVSVAELVCHELQKDELEFINPLFNEIFKTIGEGIKNNVLYEPSYFLRQDNLQLVRFVSDIETDAYEISPNWMEKLKVLTLGEREKLDQLILESIYVFKQSKVELRILEIREALGHPDLDHEKLQDLMSEQIYLEKVKREFAGKLNRIIL